MSMRVRSFFSVECTIDLWNQLAESTETPVLTIYIVADLDSEYGLHLAKEALESLVSAFYKN
jgi:hypothetical protein